MTTTKTKSELHAEIAALEKVEHLIGTNEGTYGSAEACRAVGCGDPAFANRHVYETVGGKRRYSGPDEDTAPGYMRWFRPAALSTDRKRLADLRAALKSAK